MVKSSVLELEVGQPSTQTSMTQTGTTVSGSLSGEVILKSLVVTPQTVQIGQPVTITATYVNGLGQPISGLTVQIVVQSTSSYEVADKAILLKQIQTVRSL